MTEKEFIEDIGENIRRMMTERNITQTELSYRSGIPKSTISEYINGIRLPTLKNIVNLCYVLKCKIGDLVMPFDVI